MHLKTNFLYEPKNKESVNTQIAYQQNFDTLCWLFDAFLTGYRRESVDLNHKILMMLSFTNFCRQWRLCVCQK